jgi:hypothetical protein
MTYPGRWSAWVLALTLAASAGSSWAEGALSHHSGTIEALDRAAGFLVVGEVGPWRVKEGKTEVTPRHITVTSSTAWVRVRRADGPGPSGWPGESIEVWLAPWEVKVGDAVTVRARAQDRRLVAVKVEVVTPDR